MTSQRGEDAPLVSVVIPTRDRPDALLAALRSVGAQTYRHIEIVVVDDGSTPPARPPENLGDRPISLVRLDPSVGPGEARNRGLERCAGTFVAFLDDDDEWSATKIALQVKQLLELGSSIAMTHSGYEFSGEGEVATTYLPPDRSLRYQVLRGPYIAPSTVLILRSVLEELAGFDAELRQMEDWDLFLRVSDRYEGASLPSTLVRRARHDPVPPDILLRYYREVARRVRPRLKELPWRERLSVASRHRAWMGLRYIEWFVRRVLGRRFWLSGISLRRRLRERNRAR
jgi:glycosyltransferase involved in cell wall biosynthesis